MRKIVVVAKYTFIEALKSKLLLNVIFLGLALGFISYVASELTYGEAQKISLDIGLGLISIALKIIAIFYGVGIIQHEIETRSIYLVLSRPIRKSYYLIGRLLGMSLMLLLNVLILGPFAILMYVLLGGEVQSLMIWALVFSFLESLLLLLIVVVCSLFCSKVLAILLSISAYVAGYVSGSLLESNRFADTFVFRTILKIIDTTLPNFNRLNLKDYVLYQQTIDSTILWSNLLYTGAFVVIFVLIGSFIIEQKNID